MDIFLDTADVETIRKWSAYGGLVDGVTTNPSLARASGRDFIESLKEICDLVPGPVSAEVVATDADKMVEEGRRLAEVASNVVVKVPLTWDGLRACHKLTEEGKSVNVTLCFSSGQALLAAKAGASYISPFVGRLDDIGLDGMELVSEIAAILDAGAYNARVLAASVRTVNHVTQAAMAGAHAATVPPAVFEKLAQHPLTDKGLAAFLKDWAETGQSI